MIKKIVGIYMITCTANGKCYVVQSLDIKRRFNQHKRKPPARMQEDFDLYGVDAFKFEILEECAPELLDRRETFHMNELQPEYNIKTEGHGISDEAREKLRKLHTGKKRPDISRQIKCVETDEVFESIRAAAKWCKRSEFYNRHIISGQRTDSGRLSLDLRRRRQRRGSSRKNSSNAQRSATYGKI